MPRPPVLGLLAIVACLALPPRPVDAATIAVTTTIDELNTDGDCSLREAVRAANTNVAVDACPAGQNDQTDTITVPAGTYTLTVAGNDNDAAGGDLDLRDNAVDNAVADDLVISGAGAATTIIQACAVEQRSADCPAGQGVVDRVFHVIDAQRRDQRRHGPARPRPSPSTARGRERHLRPESLRPPQPPSRSPTSSSRRTASPSTRTSRARAAGSRTENGSAHAHPGDRQRQRLDSGTGGGGIYDIGNDVGSTRCSS